MYNSSWPGFPARSIDPIALSPVDAPGGGAPAAPLGSAGGDAVGTPWYARSVPAPPSDGGGFFTALGSFFSQMQAWIAQQLGSAGGTLGGTASPPAPATPPTFLRDGELDSVGDPHLSETGTTGSGGALDKHFDSMTAHANLIDANVAGGYRVSTMVTAPLSSGVTLNRSASVHAAGGSDEVTMNAAGHVDVVSGGAHVALAPGATLTLSGGETVTENADGSVVVNAANGRGGTIATTLRSNGGGGVDVTTHVHDLAVGGDIAAA